MWRVLFLAVVLAIVLGACSARRGIYHWVRPGENLYRIGKAYGVPFDTLGRLNGIRDPHRIKVGQRLFIPGARRRLPVGVITPRRVQRDRPERRDLPPGGRPFTWPISHGTLTSRFGPRGQTFHDGIDIGAPTGTPVYAVAVPMVDRR